MEVKEQTTFKIKAPADVLLSALEKLPYGKSAALPLLSYVLVKGVGHRVSFSSTDLETYGMVTVDNPGPVSFGEVCVSLEKLKALLKSFGTSEVKLEQEGEALKVEAEGKGARYKVPGINPEDFTEFPNIEGEPVCGFTLRAEDLREGLGKTEFAIAKDDLSRPGLSGVCLRGFGNKLHIVGSDGHRLSLFEIPVEAPEFVSILPSGAVKVLSKLSGEVRVKKFEKYIVFEAQDVTYTIREIDVGYPDYLSVIPPEDKFVCMVELYRDELKEALERMMRFSKELRRMGGITLYVREGRLEVGYTDPDEGEGQEEIGLTHVEGKELWTGFNPRFILEYLKKAESERVWMKFTGEDTACVMGDDFTYLVMPMRI